jgi:hypothetical protein
VVVAASILAGGAIAIWLDLARTQVRVADGCALVEAVGRARVQLAANLVHATSTFEASGPRLQAALRKAAARAGSARLDPHGQDDSRRLEAFVSSQDELTRALDAVWQEMESGSAVQVRDLRESLDRVESRLADELGRLDHSVDAYRRKIGSFPGSLFASLASAPFAAAGPTEARGSASRLN